MSKIAEKTKNLMKRLEETNYDLFDGEKEEALDFIAGKLEYFPNYANVVIRQQVLMPIWKNRYEGQELRDKIQSIDESRKHAHECAISACDILNRISKNLGLEPFAEIDTKDRYAVAEFVGKFINDAYNDGIGNEHAGKAFDSATLDKTQEYESKKIRDELEKFEKNYAAIQSKQESREEEFQ